MYRIVFTDWKPALKKVSLTRLLKELVGLSLVNAKRNVDDLLSGKQFTIVTSSESLSKKLKSEAVELGAICKIVKISKRSLSRA
jgi:ribosomal protein L7/L12